MGGSSTKVVLVNGAGEILCFDDGPSTNHFLDGLEVCHQRIYEIVQKAKIKANLKPSTPILSLGLCLSGCEEDANNRRFEKQLLEKYPDLAEHCVAASDTIGSIYSANPSGGVVLISGTGSNSLLVNPDGSVGRCGGWGHIIGDEGGAYWISNKAIKAVFDQEDNLNSIPYNISKAKELMLEHFQIKNKFELLHYCYVQFSKSHFAALTAKLAKAAREDNDEFCKFVFREAGAALGSYILALLPQIDQELITREGGLPIVCVGSVFNSWDLMCEGFTATLSPSVSEFTMLKLTKSAAIGAAFLAAKTINSPLPINFSDNFEPFYYFKL